MLPYHNLAPERFFRERTVGFQYQLNGFLKISPGFIERISLRVCAGQLLDKPYIPFWHLLENGGQMFLHSHDLLKPQYSRENRPCPLSA